MHYLMMISNKSDMIFRMELLVRSIKKFSPRPAFFSVVINGEERKPFDNPLAISKLDKDAIENSYIQKNIELFYSPYHWTLAAPSRWFIEPKADTCVFIDVDVIACQNLQPLYDLDKNTLHGVTALNKQVLTETQWENINMTNADLDYYFNFGMLVVPSKYMVDIGKKMLENLHVFIAMNSYFAGQIALAYTLKTLDIKRNALPNEFNWYDALPPSDRNIIFLHYFQTQHYVKSKNEAFALAEKFGYKNYYKNLISNAAKELLTLPAAKELPLQTLQPFV